MAIHCEQLTVRQFNLFFQKKNFKIVICAEIKKKYCTFLNNTKNLVVCLKLAIYTVQCMDGWIMKGEATPDRSRTPARGPLFGPNLLLYVKSEESKNQKNINRRQES
jgi:hypothetical protein